jgi:hypothetical protein
MAKLLPISFIWVIKMTHKAKNERRATSDERRFKGSAIILAVVLTTLLAIIGVLFLFSSRVDSVATSAVGDNHDLKLAVDTVVAQISQVLTHSAPGIDPNSAYYNYPDASNPWLACLEPYQFGTDYFWRQVSNIYGPAVQIVQAQILPDYNNMFIPYTEADADGDGVSDSIWVQVSDVNSSKGKPIYAAIRIIDNGGMLNINTGYWFDVNADANRTDGSSQTQINLLALAQRPYDNPATSTIQADADTLVKYRCGSDNAASYTNNVIWQYGLPNGSYTPFDISDELELRYRFLLNQTGIDTRSEVMTGWAIGRAFDFQTPIDTSTKFNEWKITAFADGIFTDPNQYAYRHIATTYNMDRVIEPNGSKMFNINSPLDFNANTIYNTIRPVLPSTFLDADVAQITANLMDYIDGPNYPPGDPRYDPNNEVTVVNDSSGTSHYGFETPCIYISQIAENFYYLPDPSGKGPPTVYRSYAIELFKPYTSDPLPAPNKWQLVIGSGSPIPILWSANSSFFVIADINANAPLDISNVDANEVNIPGMVFGAGDNILLQREVIVNGSSSFVTVDLLLNVPAQDAATGWLIDSSNNSSPHSIQRGITLNKCIRKLWSGVLSPPVSPPFLGSSSGHYVSPDTYTIQAHPANKPFTNVGEIGQLLSCDQISIDQSSTEAQVRLNIADPCVQNLFNYLTVIDPNINSSETRIKGRININTAPWFVLAQLPWVSYHTPNYELARSIVAYRDKTIGPGGFDYSNRPGPYGFRNIGELMNVSIDASSLNRMDYYVGKAIPVGLLTPTDCNSGTGDAFEMRDVIFDRISNLITVRSDVFTAYILVRIGPSGPQKRVIAIFDRSGVTPTGGKVKVLAIQQVPDPR